MGKFQKGAGESEGLYLKRVCSEDTDVSRGLRYLFRFFDVDLKTAVGSFRAFDGGDISDLMSRLGVIIAQLCYYGKNKIASTLLTTIDTFLYLEKYHRDLFYYTMQISRAACADEIQEFFNARFSGLVNAPVVRSDDYLREP